MKPQTELRLRLLANGYTPIRNRDKRTFMKDWPTLTITPEVIESWDRRWSRDLATGLRIHNGLCAIDFDINDEAMMAELVRRVLYAVPALADTLVRFGSGYKEAWFCRTDEPFSRIFSYGWIKPGETADKGVHRVEIFGGSSARQFGAFGPHTVEDDGTVKIAYEWQDKSPLDVPLDDLPVITKQDAFTICNIVDELAADLGWTQAKQSTRGEGEPEHVYDLVDTMRFDCNDDVTRTLDELREAAKGDRHLRCSASWLEGAMAVNRSRCLVSLSKNGGVAIYETAESVTHFEKTLKPVLHHETLDRLGEKLREIMTKKSHAIRPDDDLDTATAKMLKLYAYYPAVQNCIVPLWATSPDEGFTLTNTRHMLQQNAQEQVGPRGGIKLVNPVDVWMRHPERVTVAGLRLRPDMPRPTYVEDGKTYINIYSPPAHIDGDKGNAGPGAEFMRHLIPGDAERKHVMQWIAHKYRYPHIPGSALVMIAHGVQGTGRGTFARLMEKVFGSQYVRQLPFATFTGKTYQSQYNDWLASSLMVIVNESSEATDGSVYQTKRNTYEHLKELCDPRPLTRLINLKGRPNYYSLSCTSFVICSNNADALPIPGDDRRFVVVANGGTREPEYWQRLNDWMDVPANVAAFVELLEAVDLSDYDAFAAPPTFEAKLRMIDEGKSELDHALDDALGSLRSPVFVIDQIVGLVKQSDHDLPQQVRANLRSFVKREVKRRCYRIGDYLTKPMINGKRHDGAYTTEPDLVAKYDTRGAHSHRLSEDIMQNGGLDGTTVRLLNMPKKPA